MCYTRPVVYAYVPNSVWIGLFCRPLVAKNLNFCRVLDFGSDVNSWRQSEKVERGCTTTNLPLSNDIKIVSVLQRLHGEIGRKSSDVQTRDEQTDRQTKNSTFLASPASPTKLGIVIENLKQVLAPLKHLGYDRLTHSFAARGR